jgi:hypothetical protein
MRPKDVVPLIFELSKMKTSTIYKALKIDFWVCQSNIQGGLSVNHIGQFAKTMGDATRHSSRLTHTMDSIRWKFTENEGYLAKSAYKMQFLGLTTSIMPSFVWKLGLPSNAIFSWLIIQNRVWKVDRLEM